MKRILVLFLAVALCGCQTSPENSDPQAALKEVAFWAHTAAAVGAQYALEENPKSRPHFERAVASLEGLAASGDFSPMSFHAVLSSLPLKELKSKEARLAITTATIVYQRYGKEISLDQNQYVSAVLGSVRDGLKLALQSAP